MVDTQRGTGPSGRPIVDVIEEGIDLYSSDGEKIGHIEEINPAFFLISKGFFGRKLYIPRTYEENNEGNRIYLSLTKSEIEEQDWNEPPEGEWESSAELRDRAGYATQDIGPDRTRIRRYEEELTAEKRPQEAGRVRIGKDVVEEEKTLDVPVMREEVRVKSRPVDREVAGDEGVFQGEEFEVPVREEKVEVRKEPRAVEELEVEKVGRQETERVAGTVRKEHFRVDDEGTGRLRTEKETTSGNR